MTNKTLAALRGVGARPADLSILDGVTYGEPLLPPVPAYELSAALRNVTRPYVAPLARPVDRVRQPHGHLPRQRGAGALPHPHDRAQANGSDYGKDLLARHYALHHS